MFNKLGEDLILGSAYCISLGAWYLPGISPPSFSIAGHTFIVFAHGPLTVIATHPPFEPGPRVAQDDLVSVSQRFCAATEVLVHALIYFFLFPTL